MKKYTNPKLELLEIENVDIITTSPNGSTGSVTPDGEEGEAGGWYSL